MMSSCGKKSVVQNVYYKGGLLCTFNPDPVWDQKGNLYGPLIPKVLKIIPAGWRFPLVWLKQLWWLSLVIFSLAFLGSGDSCSGSS